MQGGEENGREREESIHLCTSELVTGHKCQPQGRQEHGLVVNGWQTDKRIGAIASSSVYPLSIRFVLLYNQNATLRARKSAAPAGVGFGDVVGCVVGPWSRAGSRALNNYNYLMQSIANLRLVRERARGQEEGGKEGLFISASPYSSSGMGYSFARRLIFLAVRLVLP